MTVVFSCFAKCSSLLDSAGLAWKKKEEAKNLLPITKSLVGSAEDERG